MKVIIIGAGIGGLGTANLLARDGHDVHVYEKNAGPGGRAGLMRQDGFTFDTGPSWYLMPDVFARYYSLLGRSVDNELDLMRLSPAYKVFFEREQPITITSDLAQDSQTFESVEAGSGKALERYVARGEEIYRLSLKHFLYTDFSKRHDIFNRKIMRHGPDMLRLATLKMHSYVSRFVTDRRLQQILEYPMVFLGTSPFQAPAIYSLMSALDFREGVYYPRGGIYTIIQSLVRLGQELGVTYHYDAAVTHITVENGRASGIVLDTDEQVVADVVVSNADLHFTETTLVETAYQSYPEKYWQEREPGPSALLLYLGVKGSLDELEHHNLLFVDTWRENFAAIYQDKKAPEPASIYLCKPSATDSSVAPDGHENLFVLVPLPAGVDFSKQQVENMTTYYLEQIERMTGMSIISRIVTRSTFAPNDFASAYNSWQSTMLGQSHVLTQSAFFRTKNTSKKLPNLYYVGANTVPGIGLPMCLISAELVARRIREKHA